MKVLFGIPGEPELVLLAIAAIQHYTYAQGEDAKIRNIEFPLDVTIVNPVPEHDYLFSVCNGCVNPKVPVSFEFQRTWVNPPRSVYDLVNVFDFPLAYDIAKLPGKTLATCYSLMIGADANDVPDLTGLEIPEADTDVLFLDHPGNISQGNRFMDRLWAIYHWAEGTGRKVNWLVSQGVLSQGQFRKITLGKMIVGMRSPETHLACAAGRKVVELYPANFHKQFLGKFSCDSYLQVYGEENWTEETIKRCMEMLWLS